MTVLRSGSASDTGLVRSSNQDLAFESASLFAVADGMGGHAGGEVASQLAIDALRTAFGRQPSGSGLAGAVGDANTVVWQRSEDDPELHGMGTTLTAVALVNEGGRDVLALVNVGDSRIYRYHEGELVQITVDHSLAEEMVRNGELTTAEAAVHPHRHILTRALGVSPDVDVDLWRVLPSRGDRYLLCSDGLTNELGNNQISEVLSSIGDPQEASDLLVRAARTHGGSDNITVVIVDVVVGEDDGTTASTLAGSEYVAPAGGEIIGDDRQPPEPIAVPEARIPTRHERRKAERRERRRQRGRRLITFRTLLFVVILGAVLAAAYSAVKWFDTNSYFVGLNGNELVIYQGRIGGLLWYHPVEYQRTGVTTADIPADPQLHAALQSGVEESSAQSAADYVRNLTCEKLPLAEQSPATGCAGPSQAAGAAATTGGTA